MGDKKTLLSRPRTRVYDCNYNIGEGYYRPMVEELDRKYSGRSSLPPITPTFSRLRGDEDDFPKISRKPFAASTDFESLSERRSRLNVDSSSRSMEEDLEDDIINSMKKLKALRAARANSFDEEFSTSSANGGIHRQRKLNLSNKILDSVGVNGKMQEALEEEVLKKRTVKIPSLFDEEPSMTKWSSIRESSFGRDESAAELAAMARARQSRARLADLENEIDAVSERGAAREKRISNIKALIASEDAFPSPIESYRSKKITNKSVKKVTF